ncbi:hypothetical protein ALC60_13520, partial [Trachymyrmex zeteki]
DDKPRKVFSSSTETSELEGGYRLTRDRSVLHSDLENKIVGCVLLRTPQSAPSSRELRPWPGCVANFRRNSRNSRAACELWCAANREYSNKRNWRFIGTFDVSTLIEQFHELGAAPESSRIRNSPRGEPGDS